jgi:hypothetical protein
MNEMDLMHAHLDALYTHDSRGRMAAVNEWSGGRPPRFHFGRTVAGNVWRFRDDVSAQRAHRLDALCAQEPVWDGSTRLPRLNVELEQALATDAPVTRIGAGPAWWFARAITPAVPPLAVTAANADLLRGGLDAWLPDVPHRHPFMASIADGRAVSVCASVRITPVAHEAGVDTVVAHRRRGHAANAVAGWASAVQALGALALYSTSWENAASQGVAAKLGLLLYGADYEVF